MEEKTRETCERKLQATTQILTKEPKTKTCLLLAGPRIQVTYLMLVISCAHAGVCCVCAPCSHRDSFELFSFTMSRGAQEAHRAVPNEALYGDLRICSLTSCAYLLFELLNKL